MDNEIPRHGATGMARRKRREPPPKIEIPKRQNVFADKKKSTPLGVIVPKPLPVIDPNRDSSPEEPTLIRPTILPTTASRPAFVSTTAPRSTFLPDIAPQPTFLPTTSAVLGAPIVTVTQILKPESPTQIVFITASASTITVTAQPESSSTITVTAQPDLSSNQTAAPILSSTLPSQGAIPGATVISGTGLVLTIILGTLAGLSVAAIVGTILWQKKARQKQSNEEKGKEVLPSADIENPFIAARDRNRLIQ